MSKQPTLSPHRREVLLDALRPPAGYHLDEAVGTCYSADVMSALLVPMAFALFDAEDAGEGKAKDPIAVLAATQTYASRLTLYCEQGRIAAEAKAPSVLAYLESALEPVAPPKRGSFHPKLWVLRFASDKDGGQVHRVLCLSRNLTFDRSWDTILRLEEAEGRAPEGQTAPLVRFLNQLNRMASSAHTRSLAESVGKVAFAPPAGFAELTFHPIRPGTPSEPLGSGNDLFVVSPFLGEGLLTELGSAWKRVQLASRGDSLDRLDPESVRKLHGAYVFDPLESEAPSKVTAIDEAAAEAVGLSGLHAKIFSGEVNGKSFLLVGSANCTGAAFERNVEFCVRLEAEDKRVGPRTLLRERPDNAGLRALLQPYEVRAEATEPSEEELELERLEEELRRQIAGVAIKARATRQADDSYELLLTSVESLPPLGKGDKLSCWPITLSEGQAKPVGRTSGLARWRINSLVNVTSLIAFELKGKKKGVPPVRFTLKADLEGDLEGRLDAVLADTLSDPQRLMRFLLLLLAAGADDQQLNLDGASTSGGGSPLGTTGELQIPLLETLLRTFAREPGRLQAFERALRQVESAREREHELPAGLFEVWKPVEAALEAKGRRPR